MDLKRIERVRQAYAETWRSIARATGRELREKDGLLTYFSLAPSPEFNPTVVTAIPEDPAGTLEDLEHEYGLRGIGFGFEALVGAHEPVEAAAIDRGMTMLKVVPCMVLDPIPEIPELEATVVRVTDSERFAEHLRVQSDGFGAPLPVLEAFAPESILGASEFFLAAEAGADPADGFGATSIACVTGRECGIYGVSTAPDRRRRGLGAAATLAAARWAKDQGCDLVYLIATPMGEPLYRKLGFQTIVDSVIYTRAQDAATPLRPVAP